MTELIWYNARDAIRYQLSASIYHCAAESAREFGDAESFAIYSKQAAMNYKMARILLDIEGI
jgi:hypothetical protein